MQLRRQSAVSPLAIILPHPSLPRTRSSISLLSATSPHTPRSCGSPCSSSLFFASGGNRKSTDSWNSSIQEGEDDQDREWKPEQTLLLSRTLDALPAHLLTPFNGSVPPSNLLERIARGVSQAKGPIEWPHSHRATRVKLLELARVRAKEAAEEKRARSITEEDDSYYLDDTVLQPTTTNTPPNPRKPLYRQSSMDFIASAKLDVKDNPNLTRLSKRLQRTDRIISNPSYHPYSRPQTRSQTLSQTSPNYADSFPPHHVLNPSTPSSSTLYSSSSGNTRFSRPTNLRRASTLSNTSDPCSQAPDPRVQRIRRSDSFCDPPFGKRQVLKRAPSFSASSVQSKNAAKEVKQDYGRVSPCPSSDEEEKIRTKKAKKPRVASKTLTPTPASPMPCTPSPPSPKPTSRKTKAKPKSDSTPKLVSDLSTCRNAGTPKKDSSTSPASPKRPNTKPRVNLQRNPSIFGAPLPQAQVQPVQEMKPALPATVPSTPVASATPQTKTLRRVKLRPANLARRISFGSLVPPSEEKDGGLDGGRGGLELGSAFQLH